MSDKGDRAIRALLANDKVIELPRSQSAWSEKRIESFATVSRGYGKEDIISTTIPSQPKWVAPAQSLLIKALKLLGVKDQTQER